MRTCEPSGLTRSRMLRNCSGVDRRVGPMMLALIAWPGAAGRPPICADRHLHVLRADGGDHVAGGQAVVVELGRVEPDAHRVLRAEHRDVADALGAVQRIEQVGGDVVGEVLVAHAAVGGDEAHAR